MYSAEIIVTSTPNISAITASCRKEDKTFWRGISEYPGGTFPRGDENGPPGWTNGTAVLLASLNRVHEAMAILGYKDENPDPYIAVFTLTDKVGVRYFQKLVLKVIATLDQLGDQDLHTRGLQIQMGRLDQAWQRAQFISKKVKT